MEMVFKLNSSFLDQMDSNQIYQSIIRNMEVGNEVIKQGNSTEVSIGTIIAVCLNQQKAAVLWKDGSGVAEVNELSDLLPRRDSHKTTAVIIADENARLRVDGATSLERRYSSRRKKSTSGSPTQPSHPMRCCCGWNKIITPLVTRCQKCRFYLHQICVGTVNSIITSCNFCNNNLPTDYNENSAIPYQLLKQRFYSPSITITRDVGNQYRNTMKEVRDIITSMGYIIRILSGGYDGELQQQSVQKLCISACSSAISEGYFEKKYPASVINEMRLDPASRVVLLLDGKSPVAVIATAANSCVPNDVKDLIKTSHQSINLPLVTTNASHRGKRLARLLLLHELASWSCEGRTSAHLSMSLVKVSKSDKFYFSEASKSLYESFGFKLAHPRRLQREDGLLTCDFTKYETTKGVTMVNSDIPTAVVENTIKVTTTSESKRRKAG